jgi:hypothetical protein
MRCWYRLSLGTLFGSTSQVIGCVSLVRQILYNTLIPVRAGRLRDRGSSPGRVKNFHFSMLSRPVLGSIQPPMQWVPWAPSRG